MSRVRGKDTIPELAVRSGLHKAGFRFRLHNSSLPGRPDLTLAKYRSAIFVNGCFWHQHENCPKSKLPSTRHEWWKNKLQRNQARDAKNYDKLREGGWNVLIVWECEIKKNFDETIARLTKELQSNL